MVLAALTHLLLPSRIPIELVNVAFGDQPEVAPDRMAAFDAMGELLSFSSSLSWFSGKENIQEEKTKKGDGEPIEVIATSCPVTGPPPSTAGREWRLVLVDVEQKPHTASPPLSSSSSFSFSSSSVPMDAGMSSSWEAHAMQIGDVLWPKRSVMDVSIGTALWYAARGVGRMQRLRSSSSSTLSSPVPAASRFSVSSLSSSLSSSRFDLLREVLIAECYRSGAGPEVPVLLSTLGKEYAGVLRAHFRAHGFSKLGAYLDAASRDEEEDEDEDESGIERKRKRGKVIVFDASAGKGSKAVKLVREEDKKAAAAAAAEAAVSRHRTWYASSSSSSLSSSSCDLSYTCASRVVLLGMGADETLGGYTRHRRRFQRGGVCGLLEELQRDFQQLWERNLGRDDRVVMDTGREGRLPYLDEGVLSTISYVVETHLRAVCDFYYLDAPDDDKEEKEEESGKTKNVGPSNIDVHVGNEVEEATPDDIPEDPEGKQMEDALYYPAIAPIVDLMCGPGEGEKKILRAIAHLLGLNGVATRQKRAIQFGSRVADGHLSGADPFF